MDPSKVRKYIKKYLYYEMKQFKAPLVHQAILMVRMLGERIELYLDTRVEGHQDTRLEISILLTYFTYIRYFISIFFFGFNLELITRLYKF